MPDKTTIRAATPKERLWNRLHLAGANDDLRGKVYDDTILSGAATLPLELVKLRNLILSNRALAKVFYHGTPGGFSDFDFSKLKAGAFGKGLYFTDSPKLAELYATQRTPFSAPSEFQPNIRPYLIDSDLVKIDPRRVTQQLRKELHQKSLSNPATYYPDVKELVVNDPSILVPRYSQRGNELFNFLLKNQLLQR